MSIFRGSRYEGERVPRLLTAAGERRPAVFRTRSTPVEGFFLRTVVEGDRLDQWAYDAYGVAELWWIIADANPELELFDPLVPGSVLVVPL